MTEDEVFRSIEARIAEGDYVTRMPGVRLLAPLSPAAPDAIEEAERLLGHRLPRLLRRLYLEVANGGFGPGWGILGVRGGHADDYHQTAVDLYREAHAESSTEAWSSLPAGLLPICHWGCGIYSFLDCADTAAPMWGWDPNPVTADEIDKALVRQDITFTEWLARWGERRLDQPAVVQDPQTGEWRGATDEEYAEWAAEWAAEES